MIIIKHGKMVRDGVPWVPPMGDPAGVRALKASEKAREIKLGATRGQERGVHHVMLSFSCPYCGVRYLGKGANRVSRVARGLAEEALYGVDEETGELSSVKCECGAVYHRADGNSCGQINL